jgi:hypothetical protein
MAPRNGWDVCGAKLAIRQCEAFHNSLVFILWFVSNLPIYPCKVWLALPRKSQEEAQDGKRNSLASSVGLF